MICLLGGTFDPVHHGHLRSALEVRQALGIDSVRLLPCRTPPHRPAPQASADVRLAMLEAVVADEPALQVDTRELQREGPSYMVDTLRSLRAEHQAEPICLAIGMDAFRGLESWHEWRAVQSLCHLVVMHRPGSRWPRAAALDELLARARVRDAARLRAAQGGLIMGVAVTQLAISSTRIRESIGKGLSVRYLLPDVVIQRIRQENLYAI